MWASCTGKSGQPGKPLARNVSCLLIGLRDEETAWWASLIRGHFLEGRELCFLHTFPVQLLHFNWCVYSYLYIHRASRICTYCQLDVLFRLDELENTGSLYYHLSCLFCSRLLSKRVSDWPETMFWSEKIWLMIVRSSTAWQSIEKDFVKESPMKTRKKKIVIKKVNTRQYIRHNMKYLPELNLAGKFSGQNHHGRQRKDCSIAVQSVGLSRVIEPVLQETFPLQILLPMAKLRRR